MTLLFLQLRVFLCFKTLFVTYPCMGKGYLKVGYSLLLRRTMTVQYTTHVKMQNGNVQTYESGADTKENANEAALLYFENHPNYDVDEIVDTTRGPAK